MATDHRSGHNRGLLTIPKKRELYQQPAALEPLFPTDKAGEWRELMRKSDRLGGALHPVTQRSVVALLRTMNSYHSNMSL